MYRGLPVPADLKTNTIIEPIATREGLDAISDHSIKIAVDELLSNIDISKILSLNYFQIYNSSASSPNGKVDDN